jgi:hypothetical protein
VPERHTEASVTAALRRWHEVERGAVPRYAFVAQVRNDSGFSATRTFDAVALDLWQSGHHALTVYEVKVSRSDWLRELKQPDKTAAALELADHFAVVAPRGVVKVDELGERWGLLEVDDRGRVRTKRKPARLRPLASRHYRQPQHLEPFKRGLVVAMLRRTDALAVNRTTSPYEPHDRWPNEWPATFR